MHVRVGVIAGLSLLATTALAGASEIGASEIPRRPDGKPDLSGTYDLATLTPLARPPQVGDQASLSPEEARAYAEHWNRNVAKDLEPSDPDRPAPAAGGVVFAIPEFDAAAGGVGAYNTFYLDLGDSTFELDGRYPTSIIVDPPDGQLPPLTAEGAELFAEREAWRRENTGTAWWIDLEAGPYDDPELRPAAERCLLGFGSTAGPPTLPNYFYNNLKRIVQTGDHVMILAEMIHDARIIRIIKEGHAEDGRAERAGAEHDPPEVRKWLGDSVGHWEGDTLVVETVHFRDSPSFSQGSRNMKVTERFSRIDGETLLYEFTVDDPTIWTRPWSGRLPWPAVEDRVYEYACHEGNYSFGGILRGARQLEREAREAKAPGARGSRR